MKIILILGLLCVQIISTNCLAKGPKDNEKEDLYSQLSCAIIRLEHTRTISIEGADNPKTERKSNGTGFFVHWEGKLFVVSARHVVEKPYDLQARVDCLDRTSKQKQVVLLKLKRENWVFHPEDGDKDSHYVDVAAMRITWLKGKKIKHFGKVHFPKKDPVPPKRVLIFGFPGNIGFKLLKQRPFGRAGIVSMQADKKFIRLKLAGMNKFAEERCYLIDAEIFGGNSGSPIIGHPKIELLGLVSASNVKMDFAVAEPVSRIHETIDIAKDQNIDNLKCWYK
jgi:hypothetical protein